jgi:hypothetical protein
MTDAELAEEKRLASEKALSSVVKGEVGHEHTSNATVFFAWAAVGIPLAWGIYKTILSALKLL